MEVRSRFDEISGGNGLKKFCKFLKKAGFDPVPFSAGTSGEDGDKQKRKGVLKSGKVKAVGGNADSSTPRLNKMFFSVECRKTDRVPVMDSEFAVKACLYKKR